MCKENREYFIILLAGLLLASVVGVLRGEEQGQWYLIPESELRSIEEYRTKSETEKQTWLLQVRELKARADSLRADSESLNSQLAQVRELNRMLQKSFNGYEAESLTAISMKNGEIAALNQKLSEKVLEAEKHKGAARNRLVIIIAAAGAVTVYIAFKVCRFFRFF
jgi:predicted RNase H-like nuclease (RuvC/YqgF family)